MLKKLWLIPIMLALAYSVSAQQKTSLTASGSTCVANACLTYGVDSNSGAVTFTISSTSSGSWTAQFEATGDGGTTWVSLNVLPSNSTTAVTSATGSGTWQANVAGYTSVRVRLSAYSSGAAIVSIIPSTASARSNGGGGGGTGWSAVTCSTPDALIYWLTSTTGACDSGITTNTSGQLSATGGFVSASDGVHPGSLFLPCQTTLPSLSPNGVTLLGCPGATNTNWSLQMPTAIPTTTDLFSCVVTGTNCLLTDSGMSVSSGAAALGTDNSVAGTIQLSNGSSNAHTIWSSAATTSNTIKGFATAPTTTDLVECVTASTTCTFTDSGIPIASNKISLTSSVSGTIPKTSDPNAAIHDYSTSSLTPGGGAGTYYYIAPSALTMPASYTTAIGSGTTMKWRFEMSKTAAGTAAFNIRFYYGTNGSISDTTLATQSLGTATAALDDMTCAALLAFTSTTAAYWTIACQHSAATATGFGLAIGTQQFSGTLTGLTTTTASLIFGIGYSNTTGTAVITVPLVEAEAYGVN